MMLKWSHAINRTNMGQFNHHFFTVTLLVLHVVNNYATLYRGLCVYIKSYLQNPYHINHLSARSGMSHSNMHY